MQPQSCLNIPIGTVGYGIEPVLRTRITVNVLGHQDNALSSKGLSDPPGIRHNAVSADVLRRTIVSQKYP